MLQLNGGVLDVNSTAWTIIPRWLRPPVTAAE
jgi:hypothetical protein